MAITTGDKAPHFDFEETHDRRVRLSDFLGKQNVLLVFHPYAFTPVCAEEAADLQENLPSFRAANTEVVFVSCDTSAARQAWKKQLGAEFVFASDFWGHGAVAQAYGVFDDSAGVARRGTFLIDVEGTVIWALVNEIDTKREALVTGSLDRRRDVRRLRRGRPGTRASRARHRRMLAPRASRIRANTPTMTRPEPRRSWHEVDTVLCECGRYRDRRGLQRPLGGRWTNSR